MSQEQVTTEPINDASDAGAPDESREQLEHLQRELAEARQTITALERRQRIDALLNDADAIDLEAARLLTEAAVAQMDEPDVELAVKDLRRHRPYLFRRREAASPSNAMAPRSEPSAGAPVDDAAQRAMTTGDRRDLLRYLRLRREQKL